MFNFCCVSPNQFYVSRCVGCIIVEQLVCLTRMQTTSSVAVSSLWSVHNINCSLQAPTHWNRKMDDWMTIILYDILWSLIPSVDKFRKTGNLVRQRNLSSLWPRFPNIKLQRLGMTQLLCNTKRKFRNASVPGWFILARLWSGPLLQHL